MINWFHELNWMMTEICNNNKTKCPSPGPWSRSFQGGCIISTSSELSLVASPLLSVMPASPNYRVISHKAGVRSDISPHPQWSHLSVVAAPHLSWVRVLYHHPPCHHIIAVTACLPPARVIRGELWWVRSDQDYHQPGVSPEHTHGSGGYNMMS